MIFIFVANRCIFSVNDISKLSKQCKKENQMKAFKTAKWIWQSESAGADEYAG